MNAHKRRMKQQEHKREVEQLIEKRRAIEQAKNQRLVEEQVFFHYQQKKKINLNLRYGLFELKNTF